MEIQPLTFALGGVAVVALALLAVLGDWIVERRARLKRVRAAVGGRSSRAAARAGCAPPSRGPGGRRRS